MMSVAHSTWTTVLDIKGIIYHGSLRGIPRTFSIAGSVIHEGFAWMLLDTISYRTWYAKLQAIAQTVIILDPVRTMLSPLKKRASWVYG